ncbi:hypothetical protein M3Y99_01854600 [Aphelenchoides fujianensis]|nr:hypothetical protein M3Y99_01854600 [Aphelenchoides fujianensis]
MTAEEEAEAERRLAQRLEEREKERWKRKQFGMAGCIVAVVFGTHAICLWRRRSEFHRLNAELPPIPFEEFVEQHLVTGKVHALVYQPNFGVLDVYYPCRLATRGDEEEDGAFSTGPERFAPRPDLRVWFKGTSAQLEKTILQTQERMDGPSAIHVEVNGFPSYREAAFMLVSTLFAVACVATLKF